jgi:hypothetical protein
MDELICPICGRANLISAVNCRYCQTSLEQKSSQSDDMLFSSKDLTSNPNKPNLPSKPNPQDENPLEAEEPEWLKRIRELKQADEAKEKEREQWRQQTFFGQEGNKKTNHKSADNQKKLKPTTVEPHAVQVTQSEAQIKPPQGDESKSETPKIPDNDDENESLGDVSSDLPNGFTPLSNENNNSTQK